MDRLLTKLFRDIRSSKGQFIAVIAVVFVGISVYAALYMSYQNLGNSAAAYYENYRFAHLTFTVQAVPKAVVLQVQQVKGVKMVTGRLSAEVGLDIPGRDERVFGRIVSLPDRREPVVNEIFINKGKYFRAGYLEQTLIEQQFANYYKINRGSTLSTIIDGKKYPLKVIGTVGSPEYIYSLRSENDLMAAPGSFGVLYVPNSMADEMLSSKGIYNEIAVYLNNPDQQDEVISRVKSILAPYGIKQTIKRKDQLSNVIVQNELKGLAKLAVIFPILFLSVAALVMYIMLVRMVKNQRGQIGVLRAMGFSKKRIWLHYLLYSLLIGLVGSVTGALAGFALGKPLTEMYTTYFQIPVLSIKIYWAELFFGTGLTLAFCLLAGLQATSGVLKLSPIEAMRPEVPRSFQKPWLERVALHRMALSVTSKIILRNFFRNGLRTLLTSAGTILTVGLVVVSLFFIDAMDFLTTQQLTTQTNDMKVSFAKPLSAGVALEIEKIRGVDRAEPILEMPVELRNGSLKQNVALNGLNRDTTFFHLKDPAGRAVRIPSEGLLLSEQLAKKLAVTQGDYVETKSLTGGKKKSSVLVAGIIVQYLGTGAYGTIDEVGRLAGAGPGATGALLKVKYRAEADVQRELNKSNWVAVVESSQAMMEYLKQSMGMMYAFTGMMIIFSGIMGVAVIFNTTTVNILERQRELVSLRIMGFSFREVAKTVITENVILGVFALAVGLPLGRLLSGWYVQEFGYEALNLPVIIYPRTYFIVALVTMVIIGLALIPNLRYLKSLNLVEVIKTRD